MGIRFRCPFCDQRLNIKVQQAGKKGVCPNCRRRIQVPLESELEKSGRPVQKSKVEPAKTNESSSQSSSQELTDPLGEADSTDSIDFEAPFSRSPSNNDVDKIEETVNGGPGTAEKYARDDDSSGSHSAPLSDVDPLEIPQEPVPIDQKFRLGAPGTEVRPDYVDPILEAPHRVWHIRDSSDRQSGPFPGKQLRRKIDSARIKPDYFVCREDWEDWIQASEAFPEIGMAISAIPIASHRVFTDSNYRISSDLTPKARKEKQKRRKQTLSIGLIILGLLITIGLCYLLVTLI